MYICVFVDMADSAWTSDMHLQAELDIQVQELKMLTERHRLKKKAF